MKTTYQQHTPPQFGDFLAVYDNEYGRHQLSEFLTDREFNYFETSKDVRQNTMFKLKRVDENGHVHKAGLIVSNSTSIDDYIRDQVEQSKQQIPQLRYVMYHGITPGIPTMVESVPVPAIVAQQEEKEPSEPIVAQIATGADGELIVLTKTGRMFSDADGKWTEISQAGLQ